MKLNKIGKNWLIGLICCLVVLTLNFAEATPDYTQKQLSWLEHLAHQNNTHAMLQLADYYYDRGEYKKALVYIDKGKKLQDPALITSLGVFYYRGIGGVKKDYKRAIRLFKIGYKANIGAASNMLGDAYFSGSGVKKDLNKAISYYKKAAQEGAKWGKFNLAFALKYKEPNFAFNEFVILGKYSPYSTIKYRAINILGLFKLTGVATIKDLPKAYACFLISANNGDIHGKRSLKVFSKDFSSAQKNEGRKLAKQYNKTHDLEGVCI